MKVLTFILCCPAPREARCFFIYERILFHIFFIFCYPDQKMKWDYTKAYSEFLAKTIKKNCKVFLCLNGVKFINHSFVIQGNTAIT